MKGLASSNTTPTALTENENTFLENSAGFFNKAFERSHATIRGITKIASPTTVEAAPWNNISIPLKIRSMDLETHSTTDTIKFPFNYVCVEVSTCK